MAVKKTKSGSTKDGTNVELYSFDIEKCARCPKSEGCYKQGQKSKTYSVKIKKPEHIEHMEWMETDEFKGLLGERYKIEQKNAQLKNTMGYRKQAELGWRAWAPSSRNAVHGKHENNL